MEAAPYQLAQEKWEAINRYALLPAEAKSEFDNALAWFGRFRDAEDNGRPSDARASIDKVRDVADNLFRLLSDLDMNARMALCEHQIAGEPIYRFNSKKLDGLRLLEARITQIDALRAWCDCASEELKILRNGRTENLRWLVTSIGFIWEKHSAKRFNRGKICKDFVTGIIQAYDFNIGAGSIDEAMKDAIKKRGDSTTKNAS